MLKNKDLLKVLRQLYSSLIVSEKYGQCRKMRCKASYKRTLLSRLFDFSLWKKNCFVVKAIYTFIITALAIGLICWDFWMPNIDNLAIAFCFCMFFSLLTLGFYLEKIEHSLGFWKLQIQRYGAFRIRLYWEYIVQ